MNMRRILILVGLVGLGILLIANLGDFKQFLGHLSELRWYLIPLLIIVQLGSYYANARFYDSFFTLSDHHVPIRRLVEISLAINFTNQVIPAGGVAGTTYLSRSVAPEVPAGKALLAQLGRYVFSFISFIPVLIIGFVILFFTGNVGKISVRLILFLMIIIIILGLAAITLLSERTRMRTVVAPLIRLYNRVGSLILRQHFRPLTDERVRIFFDEFYAGYHDIMHRRHGWVRPFYWAMLGNLAEVATVYATFIGFGIWPNVGTVIIAYLVAIGASLLGPLTAGAGALEFGMVGALAALGIPFALAFAVVIVYRFLNMIIFLPVGFYYYRKDLA